MTLRRTAAIYAIGGAFLALQSLHLAWCWLSLYPRADCTAYPYTCEGSFLILILVGVLPQLFMSTVSLPFAAWALVDLVLRARHRGRLYSRTRSSQGD